MFPEGFAAIVAGHLTDLVPPRLGDLASHRLDPGGSDVRAARFNGRWRIVLNFVGRQLQIDEPIHRLGRKSKLTQEGVMPLMQLRFLDRRMALGNDRDRNLHLRSNFGGFFGGHRIALARSDPLYCPVVMRRRLTERSD